ncbi:MAG: dihydrofolate reductase [Spirochaetes bacterium]|nr:dihydrofolate reductase [Spirochaetota bacterium]MBX3720712.1 dihydrofolate reductase [Turneriella sp.]
MGKVKVAAFSVSLEGFGAGPNQSLENPLGLRGPELHQWFFPTKVFQSMHAGSEKGTTGIDNDFAARSFENTGAWILGRNMFGPVRGPWLNEDWKGWWGENPPYHVPIFVLTHHARKPLEMAGNSTFYFVTEGIEAALEQARKAANGKDVRIGGGVSTIRQYLQKGLVDELHFAISPVFLGEGENLFAGLNLPKMGFKLVEQKQGEGALHVVLRKG